jgi:hypothetical protein
MINHSPSAPNLISTRFNAGAAVPFSLARLGRWPRDRKANGLDFCGVGRPEARPGLPVPEGSSPSSAPVFVRTARHGGWRVPRRLRTIPFHAGRRTAIKPSLGWRLTAVGVIFFIFPLLR